MLRYDSVEAIPIRWRSPLASVAHGCSSVSGIFAEQTGPPELAIHTAARLCFGDVPESMLGRMVTELGITTDATGDLFSKIQALLKWCLPGEDEDAILQILTMRFQSDETDNLEVLSNPEVLELFGNEADKVSKYVDDTLAASHKKSTYRERVHSFGKSLKKRPQPPRARPKLKSRPKPAQGTKSFS